MNNSAPTSLVVNEIFHSVQGESSHAGRPCVFVRLTYCNLRCSYCDTAYAFYDGKEMPIDEIIGVIRGYSCKLVEITGGEPLLQPAVHRLMAMLCDDGYEVMLETGGSLDIGGVDSRVKKIVDFKCPSSNMANKNLWENVTHLRKGDEVKFVIANREDYEWSKGALTRYGIRGGCEILMSVVFHDLEPIQLVEWILQDRLDVRFQIQLHKIIWSPETRGV